MASTTSSCSSLIFHDSDGDRIQFGVSKRKLSMTVNGETISEDMRKVELRQRDLMIVDEEGCESKLKSLNEWIRVYSWFERVKMYLSAADVDMGSSFRGSRKRNAPEMFQPSQKKKKKTTTQAATTTPRAKTNKNDRISPKMKSSGGVSSSGSISDAKRALSLSHVSCQKALPIRGAQVKELETFMWNHLSKGRGGAMYVCGSPGTGKTMGVARAIHRIRERVRSNPLCLDVVHENAMTWHGEKDVSQALCRGLGLKKDNGWSMGRVRDRILNTSSSSNTNNKRKMALVVIDEIDALVHKQTTGGPLHRLFEWASLPNSNLVLIGIANGVNLISKFFPRLRALRCEPELLVFEPYNASQLKEILSQRLTENNKLFPDSVLEFVTRKVASVSGDARSALDVCRSALDIATEQKKTIVSMRDISVVLRDLFGSRTVRTIREMPMKAQILLCVCTEKGSLPLKKLRRSYNAAIKTLRKKPDSDDDVRGLLMRLEETGLIRVNEKRRNVAYVERVVPMDDMKASIENDSFLRGLLLSK